MANDDDFDFEIIPENSVQRTPRGRKSNADPRLVKALSKMTRGQTARIDALALNPASPDYKTEKARLSANIRSAGKLAGHEKVGIVFSPSGVPQVKIG